MLDGAPNPVLSTRSLLFLFCLFFFKYTFHIHYTNSSSSVFLYVDIYVLYGDLPNAFCSLRRGGSPYFSCLTFQDSVFSNTQQSGSVCEKYKMNILWKKCSKNSAWGCLDLTVYENHSWGGSSMLRKFSVESTFLINTIFRCQNIWQEIVSCLHVSGFSYLSLTLYHFLIPWFTCCSHARYLPL